MEQASDNEHQIEIVSEQCRGCTLCVKACPFGAISMANGKAVIDDDLCTFCGSCISACEKFGAIVSHAQRKVVRRTCSGDVWVFGEILLSGDLSSPTAELLGKATELALDLQTGVAVILIGHNLETAARQAGDYGADIIYCADAPSLASFTDEPYSEILAKAVQKYHPEILLGAATAVGRAVLPRTAVLVHTGLTADCTKLSIDADSGLLLQTRPAFGGNIMATIQCPDHLPQMATVRPGVLPKPKPRPDGNFRRIDLAIESEDLISGLTWLEAIKTEEGTGELRDAEIIVTAGAGAGSADGVKLVEKLAHALGGVLGASRAAVDAGWVAYGHQVGQTGLTVQPKVYIACGVSGAIQHVVGMQNSETIIAINRDPDAPIFDYADIGIVGDIMEIVPALLRQVVSKVL